MCGTCLMANNKYETFSSRDTSDAAERGAMPVYAYGCPTSTLQLLLKVSNNDINLRDIAIKKSEEKWFKALKGIEADECTQEPAPMPKTKYTKEQKSYGQSLCHDRIAMSLQMAHISVDIVTVISTPCVLRHTLVRRRATDSSSSARRVIPEK
jgi:hypothetical protein